jgi:hypothetical protein
MTRLSLLLVGLLALGVLLYLWPTGALAVAAVAFLAWYLYVGLAVERDRSEYPLHWHRDGRHACESVLGVAASSRRDVTCAECKATLGVRDRGGR